MSDQIYITNAILLTIVKLCSLYDIESQFIHSYIEKIDLSNLDGSGVSYQEVIDLIEKLHLKFDGDDVAFLLGELFEFEYTPEFSTYLQSSNNLRDLLKSATWLGQFFSASLKIHFEECNKSVSLYLPAQNVFPLPLSTLMHRFLIEGIFTYIVKIVTELYNFDTVITEIRLSYPDPGIKEVYEQYFGVPCVFNTERNELRASAKLLDIPLTTAFPFLNEKARKSLQTKLQKLQAHETISSQILNILHADPHLLGCNIASVAEKIYIGERTLQRRLLKEGTSFFCLQDQTRKNIALNMLKNDQSSIEAISEKIGFSDRRSFSRAFHRWEGCSPSQYRIQHAKR